MTCFRPGEYDFHSRQDVGICVTTFRFGLSTTYSSALVSYSWFLSSNVGHKPGGPEYVFCTFHHNLKQHHKITHGISFRIRRSWHFSCLRKCVFKMSIVQFTTTLLSCTAVAQTYAYGMYVFSSLHVFSCRKSTSHFARTAVINFWASVICSN